VGTDWPPVITDQWRPLSLSYGCPAPRVGLTTLNTNCMRSAADADQNGVDTDGMASSECLGNTSRLTAEFNSAQANRLGIIIVRTHTRA
jgi:hypothetical protein